ARGAPEDRETQGREIILQRPGVVLTVKEDRKLPPENMAAHEAIDRLIGIEPRRAQGEDQEPGKRHEGCKEKAPLCRHHRRPENRRRRIEPRKGPREAKKRGFESPPGRTE